MKIFHFWNTSISGKCKKNKYLKKKTSKSFFWEFSQCLCHRHYLLLIIFYSLYPRERRRNVKKKKKKHQSENITVYFPWVKGKWSAQVILKTNELSKTRLIGDCSTCQLRYWFLLRASHKCISCRTKNSGHSINLLEPTIEKLVDDRSKIGATVIYTLFLINLIDNLY